MGIIQKLKDMMIRKREKQKAEITELIENKIEQEQKQEPVESQEVLGSPTGEICEYCQTDIYSNEVTRTRANKKMHKRCAKKLMKEAKRMAFN